MNFLIKSTNVYRVPDVEAALALREELEDQYGELTGFKYAHKDIKAKGEVVDSYELVTATIVFNSEKEPESPVRESYDYPSNKVEANF